MFNARGRVRLSSFAPEDDDAEEDNPKAILSPATWNDPEDAFERYLRSTVAIPFPLFDDDEESINYVCSSPTITAWLN